MPATKRQRIEVFIGLHLPWRLAAPGRVVRRRVQGVDLIVPWSHALPDYARKRPTYGQNIVVLADELHRRDGRPTQPMAVLDIGANVGDTAAQILARTEARVLCVEADPYWAGFLHRNLDHDPRATIVEALLVAGDLPDRDVRAVRANGTTRFAEQASASASASAAAAAAVTPAELRQAHPGFDGLRLVKSDTDGFDTTIVPAVVEAWRDRSPVVFFEFDPGLARLAGDTDPAAVWDRLLELGYERMVVWDNGGDPLGQMAVAEARARTRTLEPRPRHLGYHFWDVAVCHRDDTAASQAFDALVPEPFSVLGAWRHGRPPRWGRSGRQPAGRR